MKKLYYLFVAIIGVIVFLQCQKSEISETSAHNNLQLQPRNVNNAFYEDPLFFEIISLYNLFYSNMENSGMDPDLLLDSIYSIQNQINSGMDFNTNHKDYLSFAFGFRSYNELEGKLFEINNYWTVLENNYAVSNCTDQELLQAAAIMKNSIDIFSNHYDVERPDCRYIRDNCHDEVFAMTIFMALTCGTLGFPPFVALCGVAVLSWSNAAHKTCVFEYNKCMGY